MTVVFPLGRPKIAQCVAVLSQTKSHDYKANKALLEPIHSGGTFLRRHSTIELYSLTLKTAKLLQLSQHIGAYVSMILELCDKKNL